MNYRGGSVHGWVMCKLPGTSPPVHRADLCELDIAEWSAYDEQDRDRKEQSRDERWTPAQRRKVAEVRSRIMHNPTMAEALKRAGIV